MCETIMEAVSLTKHFRSADKTWFTAVDGASISPAKGQNARSAWAERQRQIHAGTNDGRLAEARFRRAVFPWQAA